MHLFENCAGGPAFITVNTGPAFPMVSTLRSCHEEISPRDQARARQRRAGGPGRGRLWAPALAHLAVPAEGSCPCRVDARCPPREGRAALSCRWAESVKPTFQASLLLQKGGSGPRSEAEDIVRRVDTGPLRPPATEARLLC